MGGFAGIGVFHALVDEYQGPSLVGSDGLVVVVVGVVLVGVVAVGVVVVEVVVGVVVGGGVG
jgi:hypothetical protein